MTPSIERRPSRYSAEARARHKLRMTTVRVVRGITLQPGFELCKRLSCTVIFPIGDPRKAYCCPGCRLQDEIERRVERRGNGCKARTQVKAARVPVARRAVGLIKRPGLTDEPLVRGLTRDEGINGQIPWGHAWSGADPLPA